MELKYIIDEKIDLNENKGEKDLLGTKVYAETIELAITSSLNDSSSISIGIFGEWGSGKSSIISTLKSKFNTAEKTDIKFIEYDAWKHSEDSFKRSFIEFLVNEFEFKPTHNLNRLYDTTSVKFDYLGKTNWLSVILSSIFGIAVAIIVFSLIESTTNIKAIIAGLIFISTTGLAYIRLALGIKSATSKGDIIFSQNQFLEIFNQLVSCATGKVKIRKCFRFFILNDLKWVKMTPKTNIHNYKKIVIAIDNIDRCGKDTALSLLKATKNFLEVDNCIFLIPLADKAIIRQLSDYDELESKEFLRKFFNSTIRLSRYNQDDIYDYTQKLVSENFELKNDETAKQLSQLISQGFTNNPRRVIHFLNNLKMELDIFKRLDRENRKIAENVLFIAKTLIVKNEWNDLYNLISYDLNLLETLEDDLTQIISLTKYNFPNITNKYLTNFNKTSNDYLITLDEEQYNFFKFTRNIKSDCPEVYFRLKPLSKELHEYLHKDFQVFFDFVEKNIKSKKYDVDDIVSAFQWELNIVINRRASLEIGGSNLLQNGIEIVLTDTGFHELIPIIDTYLKSVRPIQIINWRWTSIIHQYAQYCSSKNSTVAIQKIDEILADGQLSDEGKIQLEEILIKNPINDRLNESSYKRITKLFFQDGDIKLSEIQNPDYLKQNLDTKVVESEIAKIKDIIDTQNEPKYDKLHFLIENDLIDEVLLNDYAERTFSFFSKKDTNYTRIDDLLLFSSKKKINKERLLDTLSKRCLNKTDLSDDVIKKSLGIIENVFNFGFNESITVPAVAIQFLKKQISNDENYKIAVKLCRIIFEQNTFDADMLNLGMKLVSHERNKVKGVVEDKVFKDIFGLNNQKIKKSFQLLFDEKFSKKHRIALAKKISKRDDLRVAFMNHIKSKFPENIVVYISIYSNDELINVVYNELRKYTSNTHTLKQKIDDVDKIVPKEILIGALEKMKNSSLPQGRKNSIINALNQEIEKRMLVNKV